MYYTNGTVAPEMPSTTVKNQYTVNQKGGHLMASVVSSHQSDKRPTHTLMAFLSPPLI